MTRQQKTFIEFLVKRDVLIENQQKIINEQQKQLEKAIKGNKAPDTLIAIAFDEMNKKLNEMRETVSRQNEIIVEQEKRIESLSSTVNRALNGEAKTSVLEDYKPL